MKINAISFNIFRPQNVTTDNVSFQNYSTYDTFECEVNGDKLSFIDFEKQLAEKYPDKTLENVIEEITSDSKNIAGEGTSSIVYNIPKINDYVLKKSKKEEFTENDPYSMFFIATPNISKKYNFGQAVAENIKGNYKILKKVNGEPYSFFLDGNHVQYKGKYLKDIEKISKLPLGSYIDFADKLNYINSNVEFHSFDYIMPNNLLIDNETINIVDLLFEYEKEQAGLEHMIHTLLQGEYFNGIFNTLSYKEKDILIPQAKLIIAKAKTAAALVGLPNYNCILEDFSAYKYEQMIKKINTYK